MALKAYSSFLPWMWGCLSFCLTRNSKARPEPRAFFLSSTFIYLRPLRSPACQEGIKQVPRARSLSGPHPKKSLAYIFHRQEWQLCLGFQVSLVLLCRAVCLTLPTKQQPAVCPRGCLPARNPSKLSSLTTFQALLLNPGKDKKLEDKEVRI